MNWLSILNFPLIFHSKIWIRLKRRRAASFDVVYPEFIKNYGTRTKEWIVSFFNDILRMSRIPKLFKQAKVITILKPGKDGTHTCLIHSANFAAQYLFQCINKSSFWLKKSFLFARLVFDKTAALLYKLWLSHHVEYRTRFQRKLKIGYIDVYRSHYCVWHCLERWVDAKIHASRRPCAKLSKLLNNMLSNRFIQVFSWCQE
jgi:hypothetical protein